MSEARPPVGRTLAVLARAEDIALALALAGIVLFPISEVVLRGTQGISGSTPITRHLVLLVGMLGGAVAAREGRMLALSTVDAFLKGWLKTALHVFSYGVAAAVALFLAEAGREWVAAEMVTGQELAWGIPLWWVQAVLPLGFALVAVRSVLHKNDTWQRKLACAGIALAIVLIALNPPLEPARLVTPALILLGAATLFGAPIFVTLGGAALILLWGGGETIASVPVDHYSLVTNATLPSIPLFTLAGYFLAEGGASKRLIAVFQSLFGSIRGGPAIVTALVCAFFTSFTGASGVTILALGALLLPILLSAGYSERSALGLITGGGSLGLLLPPCLPLILYAIVAKVEITEMFLGGILPGTLLILMTVWWGIRCGPRDAATRSPFVARAAWRAAWEAKWELALPVVALWALFSGRATPVEAAAITALYAFVVEVVIYRDLSPLNGTRKVLVECGIVMGGVLMILGVALGFTKWMVLDQIPDQLSEWVAASVESPLMFLLLLNVFLLVVGCLMDIFSAIIVVVPLIVPMGEHFGIHPVHLGIVFLANLELGYLTPPVGMNLFLSAYRFDKPVMYITRASLPMLFVLALGVVLITYVPAITTWLPSLFAE